MGDKSKWEEVKEYWSQWWDEDWDWRWRNAINIIDDPVDDVKHALHGLEIFGFKIYLPGWLMPGSGNPDK